MALIFSIAFKLVFRLLKLTIVLQEQTDLRRFTILRHKRAIAFLSPILSLPMQVQRIYNLRLPCQVFDRFQQFQRSQ